MSRATVYLDVTDSRRRPLWVERRIRDRAQSEADWIAREGDTDVVLVVHARMRTDGRILAGICDRLYRVTMHGLELQPSATVCNRGDITL